MNNYCTKCGQQINENHKYCPNCGNKIESKQINNTNNEINDGNQANILCLLSLILTFGSSVLSKLLSMLISNTNFLNIILGFGPLAGLVLMIVARVKYPKSVFAKVLMWIYILTIIISIIAIILYFIFAVALLVSCASSFSS